MSVLLLTILGSLLLAAFFVAAFIFERHRNGTGSQWHRDSLLPLEDSDPSSDSITNTQESH